MSLTIGVTGASGYIGRALMKRLRDTGHALVTIGRKPLAADAAHRMADLAVEPEIGITAGLDALIHLAANTSGDERLAPAAECRFADALARDAARTGCRFVFVSSQAAAVDAPSSYGRTKAAIEALVLAHGAVVVRPGLVYGGEPAGLYALLVDAVRRSPLIPDLRPRPKVQPLHVDDLAIALVGLCVKPLAAGRALNIAGPPVDFDEFLEAIARYRVRGQRMRLPLPVPWAIAGLRFASRILGPRLAPQRLDSLLRLPALECAEDLRWIGLQLRDLETGLTRGIVGRRNLLREAARLSRALLGRPVPRAMLARYARALPMFGVHTAAPASVRMPPSWLAALDTSDARAGAGVGSLAWRLGVIGRLAESEPSLAHAFIMRAERAGLVRMLMGLIVAGVVELRNRMLAPVARYWSARQP